MDREILVAKSYQGLPIETEPYKINGKEYVKVRLKSGQLKQVRSYTEAEYKKYNPSIKVIQPAKSAREIFGFGEKGYIIVFKGDTYENRDFFSWSPAKYCRPFGWYASTEEEMPQPYPVGVTPVRLPWDAVKKDEMHLKDEKELVNIVAEYIYEPGKSKWVGEVGDRLRDVEVTCTRKILLQSIYGDSTLYCFIDNDENQYTWTTTSTQNIEECGQYLLTGTLKNLETYRNVKQNNLKNCRVREIESQAE